MNRRQFLIVAGGTAAIAAGGYGYYRYQERAYIRALAAPQGYPLIWDEATVQQIGRAYRQQLPAEDDRDILLGHLTAATGEAEQIPAVLPAVIQKEYAAGQTLVLEGWVLAETEARQCALFSLI